MTFSLDDLRGLSRPDQLRAAAQYAGVEPKVMEGIWRTESSYGKNMRSPKGAEGHFGLMPETRAEWQRRLNTPINPNDFTESLLVSAYQMRENMTATKGNVGDSLRMYNSGTNRAKWDNPETQKYAAKVLGVPFGEAEAKYVEHPDKAWDGDSFRTASFAQIMYGRGNEPREAKAAHTPTPKPVDFVEPLTPRGVDLGHQKADSAIAVEVADQTKEAEYAASQHFGDLLSAGFRENSIVAAGVRAYDRLSAGQDRNHAAWLRDNLDSVYKDATDDDHLNLLLQSGSSEEYNRIQAQMSTRTEDRRKLESQGKRGAMLYSLGGGLLDPAGITLGVLTDGAFTAAGISGSGAIAAGRIGRGLALTGAEGAIGNLAGTALIDASGEHQGLDDYAMSATIGAMLGFAGGAAHVALKGSPEAPAVAAVTEHLNEAQGSRAATLAQAAEQAGPNADKDAIVSRAATIEQTRVRDTLNEARTQVPIEHRLMPMHEDDALTSDPAVQAKAIKDNNLDLIADESQQKMFAELRANADRINSQNPTDARGLTRASAILPGGESTAMTLLKSENPIFEASAKMLLENTTGAGGRRNTAALTRHIYQSDMQQHMFGWKDLTDAYRRSEGGGLISEHLDPTKLREFNRRVFYEVEARGKGNSTELNPLVIKGADMWEKGMEYALKLQKDNKTIGYGRLPETAKGYVTHRLSVEKVVTMSPDQKRAVYDVLSQQFQTLNEYATKIKGEDGVEKQMVNFDKKFSDNLAKEYLGRATQRQHGYYELPVNIHEPQAADMVADALEAMNLDKYQRADIMGALARGGAGYTKGRLKLDMSAPIPDGNGGTMPLGDLFEHDMHSLFHSYTLRVSGEAALARYGVMGTKGLKTMLDAAIATGPVTPKARKAFEQMSNEFMNMRVGDKRHAFLDNVSVATSAARLGQAVINQFGDYSNAVASLGVSRAMSSVGALPRIWKEVGMLAKDGKPKNPILRDLDHMSYVGMEDYASERLFDVRDYDVQIEGRNDMGTFGRVIRNAANAQYILSGHRRLVAVQTRGMAEKIMDKAMTYIRDGKEDAALRDMGFGTSLRERVKANIDKVATFDASGRLTGVDLHAGDLTPEELMSIRQGVLRGSGQIVQRTFIGETAPFVHDSVLGLLYKFRSYSITAMEKQWSRNVMNHGQLMAFVTLAGSMSWALPLQMARVHSKTVGMSRKEADEYKKQNLNWMALGRATLNYAGASGLTGDIVDAGAGFAGSFGGQGGKDFAAHLGQSSRVGTRPLVGGTIAPPIGLIEDANKAVHGDTEKMLKLLPGSNMIGVQNLLNWATQDDE